MILWYLFLYSFLFFSHMCVLGRFLLKKVVRGCPLNFLMYTLLSSCVTLSSKLVIIYEVDIKQHTRWVTAVEKLNFTLRLGLVFFTSGTSDLHKGELVLIDLGVLSFNCKAIVHRTRHLNSYCLEINGILNTHNQPASLGQPARRNTCSHLSSVSFSSVPIHMLPIPTLDQAHHSPRAAWATQLPPSSLRSTPIRHTGTELRWNVTNALLLMLQDWLQLCGNLVWP